jgi:hypothetical protein
VPVKAPFATVLQLGVCFDASIGEQTLKVPARPSQVRKGDYQVINPHFEFEQALG